MNALEPGLAQKVNYASRQVIMTKSLIEKAKTFDERKELERQLSLHEEALQAIQNEVRNSWGR